ncbi:hypothetical protein BKA70DRAFT_644335 [Coprinopsis sp. MPI-PUGE-AT-0042]|nr:hypothetical protein BKA70DRAFT_644335 [Coprinopsis sp. MPI-PUGE-AT-0042]
MSPSSRNIAITSTDGHTGHLIAELLLTDDQFRKKFTNLACITLNPTAERNKALEKLGAVIVPHIPGDTKSLLKAMKASKIDTVCLIPPAVDNKLEISKELLEVAKEGDVPNSLLISSAGCDLADPKKEPRLREFIEIESLFMEPKGDKDTKAGLCPVVIRAGFYAENILLYNEQAKRSGKLPIPLGQNHKFAPVALGDIANLAAHVLTGTGPHGFSDEHRGQIMIATGPLLLAGTDLANVASESLGTSMEYEDISEEEAKQLLDESAAADSEGISDSEKQILLEYYRLVREGKTNYVATTAFKYVTGEKPTEPEEFFHLYEGEFKPKRRRKN